MSVMNKPEISIIIPVYNAGEYIERCLQSILGQTFGDIEVITVDDGSTDSSPEICDRFASLDPRVKSLHKANGGVSSARNHGLKAAEGEYVMFVDADDALSEGALSAFAGMIAKGSPDFILGSYNIFTNDEYDRFCCTGVSGHYAELGDFLEDALGKSGELFRSPWAKAYRLSVIRGASLMFDESLCYAEDKLFVYSFLLHARSAAAVDVPVYEYYRRSGSLSWGRTDVRRASQILEMLPGYFMVLESLKLRYPESRSLAVVFHNDLFCGDIMRVFRVFMKFRTDLLTEGNVKRLYSMMDADGRHPSAEKVPGERIVLFFHRSGLHALSVHFYRFLALCRSAFRS